MNSSDEFKRPSGFIGMILHKGGEYDIETDTIKGGEILEKVEFKNLIVNSASSFMAQRMAPGAGANVNTGTFLGDGLQCLAVGTIVDQNNPGSFNFMSPPAATVDQTKLQYEISRKEFTSWSFIDGTGADSGSNPTNVLKLATTFMETEAVGPLVEMGLFGGNATVTAGNETAGKDTGIMFNYKTFPVNIQAA